jgi:hypothetical protein
MKVRVLLSYPALMVAEVLKAYAFCLELMKRQQHIYLAVGSLSSLNSWLKSSKQHMPFMNFYKQFLHLRLRASALSLSAFSSI